MALSLHDFKISKKVIDVRKTKSGKSNPEYNPNYTLRKEIFTKALGNHDGEYFFVARVSAKFKGNQLLERDTACIVLCEKEHKEYLLEYAAQDADMNINQAGFLSPTDITTVKPTGLSIDGFCPKGKEHELKAKLNAKQSASTPDSICLPQKNDAEYAIKSLSENGVKEFKTEEVLDFMEQDFANKGIQLKSNWRFITRENFKIWYSQG